jgi:hypothetical protein
VTTIGEIRDLAVRAAREVKTEHVARLTGPDVSDEPSATDIGAMVEGWRAGRPVVRVMLFLAGRDDLYRTAQVVANGFSCDALAVTTESWKALGGDAEVNPVTGRRWEPGEMQDVAYNHDGVAQGWVVESLTTLVVNRAGDNVGGSQDYRITRQATPLGVARYGIEWVGEVIQGDGQFRGFIPEMLADIMAMPTVAQLVARSGASGADFGLDDVEAQAHSDAAVVKQMVRSGFQGGVALISDSPERSAVLDESLRHLPGGWEVTHLN